MARKSPEVFGAQCSRKYKTNFPETEKPSVRAKTGGAEKLMKQNEELKARIMKVSPRNYASRDFNMLFK